MAFGINIGKQDPTTPGVSHSEDQSSGGSSEASQSSNSSFRNAGSIWGPQGTALQGLYGQGAGMFGAGGQAGVAQGQAQSLYDKSIAGFDRLMNPGVNPQLAAYSGDVQRNLERNLLPAIQSQAGQFGQGGGTRQGVAQGLALSDSNQQITDMAANLYNQDMNRMGQAMSMAPQLGQFGQQIPWYAMNQYSGILGDPTQLQGAAGSQGTSSSSGGSWNQSSGFSDATTASGGGGWDFGFGKGAG